MEKSIIELKKLISMAMTGVVAVSLAACGRSGTAKTIAVDVATTAETETTVVAEDAKTKETEAPETPAAGGTTKENLKIGFVYIGDESKGRTTVHYNSAMEVKEKLGLNDSQTTVKRNIPENGAAKDAAMDLADQGCQIIFANSSGHESYVIEAIKECPDVQLCHATGFQAAPSGLSNIHNCFTPIYESHRVSGVATGLELNQMVEGGTVKADTCKIGYVGACPHTGVISGCTSSFLGVCPVCPDATMGVKYTNSWASFGLEKEVADTLISNGYILISQHTDTTSAPTACEAADVPCVGYNVSMIATVPKQALTSVSNNWATYVIEVVQYVIDGIEAPVSWCKGFSGGAVLITGPNEAAVVPRTKEKVGEVEAKLTSGELHVLDTSTWTVGSGTLDAYKKDGSDIEYISDGYFRKSESGSAPALDILIDGITTIDN